MSNLVIYPTLLAAFLAVMVVLQYIRIIELRQEVEQEESWRRDYSARYQTMHKRFVNLRNCIGELSSMPSDEIPERLFDEDDEDDETLAMGG